MGRLTEIIYCTNRPASEIEREQLSRLDLLDPATNSALIELRRQNKRARAQREAEPLFEGREHEQAH